MNVRLKLSREPIIEAVFVLRYDLPSGYDWALPGQLYEKIKTEYPKKGKVEEHQVQIPHGTEGTPSYSMRPKRMIFQNEDQTVWIQIGESDLVVNKLPPYGSWEAFSEIVKRVIASYREVVGELLPKELRLRYINHLPSREDGSHTKLEDIISVSPPLSGSLDRPLAAFFQRYELVEEALNAALVLQVGYSPERPNVVVLDLEIIMPFASESNTEEALLQALDRGHDRIEEAFVSALNPQYYDTLK